MQVFSSFPTLQLIPVLLNQSSANLLVHDEQKIRLKRVKRLNVACGAM
jgi:hypothetical protein